MTTDYLENLMEYKKIKSLNQMKQNKLVNDILFDDEFNKVNDLIKLNNSKQMIRDLNNSNEMIFELRDENKNLRNLNKRLGDLNEKLKDENLFYTKVYRTHLKWQLIDN